LLFLAQKNSLDGGIDEKTFENYVDTSNGAGRFNAYCAGATGATTTSKNPSATGSSAANDHWKDR
jgi:hypothetical protein